MERGWGDGLVAKALITHKVWGLEFGPPDVPLSWRHGVCICDPSAPVVRREAEGGQWTGKLLCQLAWHD